MTVGGALALRGAAPGPLLARYDQTAVVAVVVLVVTTAVRAIGFETADARHVVRWVAIVALAGATLYASAWARPVARSIRSQAAGFDDLPESSPLRRESAALHRRSSRAMTLAVMLGVLILFLS